VPTVRCSRVIAVPVDKAWAAVSDVRSQDEWWPRVARIEGVTPDGFTQVMQTKSGRPVRADFRFEKQDAPYVRVWTQRVEGSPFERVLRAARTTMRVEPAGDGAARVTIEQRLKMRGFSRFGGVLVRRATRRVLGAALDGLEELLSPSGA